MPANGNPLTVKFQHCFGNLQLSLYPFTFFTGKSLPILFDNTFRNIYKVSGNFVGYYP
ncbi:MAG: hypothetical protein JXA54_11685 [Candidatus Heimdallarchaeota archaeon]|nr:hypothetical protein [Candidatus Heimdallarchaeota archaeon]